MTLKKPIVALLLLLLFSCQSENKESNLNIPARFKSYPQAKVLINSQELSVVVAKSDEAQKVGLSGTPDDLWPKNLGMLFFYSSAGIRSFWMPDTYFPLDIIYIDQDGVINHIDKNVPHHPGKSEPPKIWRGKSYYAQHVLELKHPHPYKIQIGDLVKIEFSN